MVFLSVYIYIKKTTTSFRVLRVLYTEISYDITIVLRPVNKLMRKSAEKPAASTKPKTYCYKLLLLSQYYNVAHQLK